MRIVAGTLRGKIIEAPGDLVTRPTMDRVREALFSSVYSRRGEFDGAVVLDAFAGTGALGLEALSRGAAHCTFFERDAKAAGVLKRNIASCGLDASRASVVQRDVFKTPPSGTPNAFDLVFLDPPYAFESAEVLAMVARLGQAGALSAEALIVYEHALDAKERVRAAAEQLGFDVCACKKYGKTGVSFLEVQ